MWGISVRPERGDVFANNEIACDERRPETLNSNGENIYCKDYKDVKKGVIDLMSRFVKGNKAYQGINTKSPLAHSN